MDDTTRRGKTGNSFRAGFDSIYYCGLPLSLVLNEGRLGGERMVGGWMNGGGHACFWETDIDIDMDMAGV